MKKILFQILLILLIISIGMISAFITSASAQDVATLNYPASVKEGDNFTVSLGIPSDASGAQAKITVKYSNGITEEKSLLYVKSMNDRPNSVTFNAKTAGNATITATGIKVADKEGEPLETDGTKSGTINIVAKTTPTPTQTPTSTTPTTTQTTTNPISTPATTATEKTVTFKDVNETVYTTERCNVRKGYSTSSAKITTLDKGISLKRTGTSSAGWSRVEYNGSVAYISSQYLSVKNSKENVSEDVKFKDVNEKVYVIQNCNLRKGPSTDTEKAGNLKKNTEVTRVGISDNGWSKLNYNGQTVYVVTKFLTTIKPGDEGNNVIENENVIEENVVNNDVELTAEQKEEQKLNEIKEEIGVLPEVGTNIATTMYIVVTIIALAGGVSGIIYYRKNTKMEG